MLRTKTAASVVLLLICIAHIVFVLGYLLREGRLSIVPIYDDVVYLNDAMTRLSVFYSSGIAGVVADLSSHPAHAPLLALTGVAGLAVSAGQIWGPYLASGAWLLLIVAAAVLALRNVPAWSRIGILVAAIAAPMFGSVLAEFRPDPVWGLLVGLGLVINASTDLLAAGRRRLFALGLLFGLAILAKPTAAPASALVLAVAFSVKVFLTLLAVGRPHRPRLVMSAFSTVVGALLVVLPYAATNGAAILTYVTEVMGSDSVWRTKTSLWGHLSYYLRPDTARLMLGWIWYAFIPAYLLCGALLLRKRDYEGLWSFVALMAAVCTAYAIVSVSGVKSLLIGSLLYGAIIMAFIWCMGKIVVLLRIRPRVVVVVALVVFAFTWTPRAGMVHRSDPSMLQADVANRAAFPVVFDALSRSARKTVLVSVPGPVYSASLDFLLRQRGVQASFAASYTWGSWELFEEGARAADVVVLAEQGMVGQALGFSFPSVAFQGRLLEWLKASPSFRGRPVLTDDRGRSVWVFSRLPG